MNNLEKYSNQFFNDLEIFEDTSRGHCYKSFVRQAVSEFLENETKVTALAVYESFFDSYRITLEGESNPFVDLLDILLSYEENASTLIDKQRDHYIHSVNVFILGLCVYSQNANFRAAFDAGDLNKSDYPFSYDTKHEEFFYRWGLASLFHDVGYPVEIIGRQLSKFMDFVTKVGSDGKVSPHLEYENFEALNSIAEIIPKHEFIRTYSEKYDDCAKIDLLKPNDLLAHRLHVSLGVNLEKIKAALDGFVGLMAKSGFIDHGYFSAIIVLKWYGFLIQSCKYKSEYFFNPILNSASAILLHNFYKNVIMKPPFNRGYLSPRDHSIAFLLILCDELQEWNREAYGITDKKRNAIGEASLVITDKRLDMTYLVMKGMFPENFSAEKEELFRKLLDMKAVFSGGFSIGCEIMDELATLAGGIKDNSSILPRPLLDNLEKLAIAIHELFNKKQYERHPDDPVSYPRFSDLPDTLKYSNLRQARTIAEILEKVGWEMRPQGSAGSVISELSNEIVETLAGFEHGEWVLERVDSGWMFGEVKDVEKKISPYLIPYEDLPEHVKDLDRDVVRNIPELLDLIGMAIYERNSE